MAGIQPQRTDTARQPSDEKRQLLDTQMTLAYRIILTAHSAKNR